MSDSRGTLAEVDLRLVESGPSSISKLGDMVVYSVDFCILS